MTTFTDNYVKKIIMSYSNEIKKTGKRPPNRKVEGRVVGNGTLQSLPQIVDAKNRVNKWIKEHDGVFPNYVNVCGFNLMKNEYKILWNMKETTPKPQPKNEVYEYFCKTFGKKPQTIDECLQIVNAKGYAYYYNDKYTNKESINRIQKRQGINCTDACHLFWNLAKALNYEVRCIHVKCRGGDGHVRLQLKHPKNTKGEWINRDPACALSDNGKGATCNWCLDGTTIAVNPQWFMNDVLK